MEDIVKLEGERTTIKGWLQNKSSKGKIQFLWIRDGTGIIQGVMVKGEVSDEVFELYDQLTQESSLEVTGIVRKDQRAPGGYELNLSDVKIVQIAQDYPITPKSHGSTFLFDHRHLYLRSKRPRAVLKVRDELIWAIRSYFYKNNFVLIDTPILTGAVGETTTTLFETEYLNEGTAYLAQTGQLYLEAAIASFGKVFCFGPTFRAEKSKTRRHLTEFWMVEAEEAFYDNEENMDLQEDLVVYFVDWILEKCQKELKELERDISALEKVQKPFPRISYDEAVEKLQKAGSDIQWGSDFGGTDETILTKMFERPVFVYDYPKVCRAFYMKPHPEREGVVLCADLLAPEGYGEIIGGSQRNDDYESLKKRIEEENLPKDAYRWYLDLRKYGSVPHSGFGLGVERTVVWICGLSHIRESIPFPRTIYRLYP
ncbi:MAG: asparagine--tRNA ligase [candidate division Zixibacteria bacterium SM23_73_3]|nr:MAG: asparagine--tRNA ligase [candidate division Zixibacteria bacterium SM23_73_3]